MSNQSILSIPPNLDDPIVLRRFLSTLTARVDQIVGNRDPASEYALKSETATTTAVTDLLDSLNLTDTSVGELTEELSSFISANTLAIEQLQAEIDALTAVVSTKIDDAPSDGSMYVRKDAAWVVLPS